jgi:hypothetical protein
MRPAVKRRLVTSPPLRRCCCDGGHNDLASYASMPKLPVGLGLIFLYAAVFSWAAWTAEEPDDGPGAFAVMLVGFVFLGAYLFARFVVWLSDRPRAHARGFEVQLPDPRDKT